MSDSPENKCPEPESQVAVHPVWGCDNEAIKDEFRRLQAERDKYLSWFQKADAELERLHFENEQRESGRSPQVPNRVCVVLTEAEADWLAASVAPESEISGTAQGIYDKINLAIGSSSPSRSDSEGELRSRIEELAASLDREANGVMGVHSLLSRGVGEGKQQAADRLRSLLVPKEEA